MSEHPQSVSLPLGQGPKTKGRAAIIWLLYAAGIFFLSSLALASFGIFSSENVLYISVCGSGLLVTGIAVFVYFRLPKPETAVWVDQAPITPGESFQLNWEIKENRKSAAQLTITLFGFERAVDDRGSSSSTYEHIFYEKEVAQAALDNRFAASHPITIPSSAYPSFDAKWNHIYWMVQFKYDAGVLRPPIERSFVLTVEPALEEATRREREERPSLSAAEIQAGLEQTPDFLRGPLQKRIEKRAGQNEVAPLSLGREIKHNWTAPPGDVRLDLSGAAYRPGETLSGTISWTLSQPVAYLDLRLRWYTQGKGSAEKRVVQILTWQSPDQRDTKRFEIRLPAWPHSFSGKYIALKWEVDAAMRLPAGERRSLRQWLKKGGGKGEEIVISPTGRPLPVIAA